MNQETFAELKAKNPTLNGSKDMTIMTWFDAISEKFKGEGDSENDG